MEHSQSSVKNTEASGSANFARTEVAAPVQHPLARLQAAVGNRAVQRLIESGAEADAGAEHAPGDLVHGVLNAPGATLDPETRARMESTFGLDFSGVRVHTDAQSAQSAKAVQAHAFTSGQDIVFGEGRYAPGTAEGERLLAHELTHVVQQAAGPVAGTPTADGSLSISDPDDAFEQAAEAHAGKVAEIASTTASETSAAPAATPVQRSWLDDVGDFVSDAGSAVASGVGSVVNAGENVVSDVASGVSNVASDVWSGAKNVAGDVASGVSDVASDAWSGAKNVAGDVSDVAGDVWGGVKTAAGDVADFGKGVYGQMKEDAGYVQKGVGYVNKGVDWLEDEAKGGTHWLADKAKGIPVLEQLAGAGESVVDTAVDVQGGVLKGVTGMAGGLLSAAADPVDTAKALYTMSEHIPGIGLPEKLLGGAYDLATTDKSLGAVADETLNPMSDLKYWGGVGQGILSPMEASIKAGKPGEAAGQAGVLLASFLMGEGEVGAVAEGTEVGQGVEATQLAAKGAEGADAALAEAASQPVKIPVNPGVDPVAPTQLPAGPTELPPPEPGAPYLPDLENPTFPQNPVPKIEPPPPEGFPQLPPTPASPLEQLGETATSTAEEAGGTPLRGMDIKTLGTPTGEIGSLTDAEIDAFVNGMEGNAKSSTMFEMPGQNPETGAGLQGIEEEIKAGPNPGNLPAPAPTYSVNGVPQPIPEYGIPYNVNHYFSGVEAPRIADLADIPERLLSEESAGTVREFGNAGAIEEGASVIPEGTGITGDPVPETTITDPGGNPAVNRGGNPLGDANAEVRYHSEAQRWGNGPDGPELQPRFPGQGPTVQVNTPTDRFGWLGDRDYGVTGNTGMYLLPDGTWTANPGALGHWPVGG